MEETPELKIEVIADDAAVDRVLNAIVNPPREGDLYDGEIAILPMERAVRLHVRHSTV